MRTKLFEDIVELIMDYENESGEIVGCGMIMEDYDYEYNGQEFLNITADDDYIWTKVWGKK